MSQASNFGNCVTCGRLDEPAWTQIGPSCSTAKNSGCTNLPACHEGTNQGGYCVYTDIIHGTGAIASQSSTLPGYTGGAAHLAIDDNYDTDFFHNSVTHTNNPGAWWKVDFQVTKKVKYITLYHRTDWCNSWGGDLIVEYSTDNVNYTPIESGTISGATCITDPITIHVPKAVSARFLRVRLAVGSYLSLAEVWIGGW